MTRDRSSLEALLTYATFFALSLAIHIVVILGNRPLDPQGPGAPPELGAASSTPDDARAK